MQVKGKESYKAWAKLGLAGALLAAAILPGQNATAQVVGRCDTCHTMHNSQDANVVVHASQVGFYAGWTDAATGITGGTVTAEQKNLLISDCVACHSNSGVNTIITDSAGNQVPIVFNTGSYPAGDPTLGQPNAPLAGGNFRGTVNNTGNGHNVRGISADDPLAMAPGAPIGACGNSCHTDLTRNDGEAASHPDPTYQVNGCKGCHLKVGHHNPNAPYRYLGGHDPILGIDVVDGIGDSDWEQSVSDVDHNIYKRQSTPDMSGDRALAPIGMFCAGCHLEFHASGVPHPFWGYDNGGDADNTQTAATAGASWLRHPTNVDIPSAGEYAVLTGGTIPYSPQVPVAQDLAGTTNIMDLGDQVMCLSCHRAHASDQPDALRFPYADMTAHAAAAPVQDTGCFFCHRTKDT